MPRNRAKERERREGAERKEGRERERRRSEEIAKGREIACEKNLRRRNEEDVKKVFLFTTTEESQSRNKKLMNRGKIEERKMKRDNRWRERVEYSDGDGKKRTRGFCDRDECVAVTNGDVGSTWNKRVCLETERKIRTTLYSFPFYLAYHRTHTYIQCI